MGAAKEKIFAGKKLLKSAKRVIEPLIKLSIYKQRAFHRLNHWFISNTTGENYFSLLAVTLQKTIRLTEWVPQKKKFSLVEKLVKSAKRVIEPFIKLPIYKQRAFHRLNHRFIPNSTGEIVFTFLTVTILCYHSRAKTYTRLNTERAANHENQMVASASHVLPSEYISCKEVQLVTDYGIWTGTLIFRRQK